ncbi:MAG TPA: hypothetical protein VHR55_12830 [Candidatus Limnocylindria bacterium]|nr:hypothetical protein [Candidatus Limnocylindria bacterium]
MTFADGWICRSCWKPNRARDARCYRCKTPRDADAATVEQHRRERERRQAQVERVPVVVGEIPARVFSTYSRLSMGLVFLSALFTIVTLNNPERSGDIPILAALTAGLLLYAVALRWSAAEMRAANPWAFAVGILVSVFALAGFLATLTYAPELFGRNWIPRVIGIVLFSIAGITAFIGLVMRLMPAKAE